MARTAKTQGLQDDAPQTQARKTFDANVKPMATLVTRIYPKELTRATRSVKRATEKWIETKEKNDVSRNNS
jgi:hypothetical protein